MMDLEYYKTIRYYVECITSMADVEINALLKLVDNCPKEYTEAFRTKKYNLNYANNFPDSSFECRSLTTVSLGICYYLAKSKWKHAEDLIKPLLSILNCKIAPRPIYSGLTSTSAQEKLIIERMLWCNFSIITCTLSSYASTLSHDDTNLELILKTLALFWFRIAKSLFKLINIPSNNFHTSKKSTNKVESESIKASCAAWYVMALSHTSFGLFLSLDSENLEKFIINPENFHQIASQAQPLNFEIPDIIIRGINDLLNQELIDVFKDKGFSFSQNFFSQPKRKNLLALFITSISFLSNRTGLPSSQKEKQNLITFQRISNTRTLMKILTDKLRSFGPFPADQQTTTLRGLVQFEQIYQSEDVYVYSKCLAENTTFLVRLIGEHNISELEELSESFFRSFKEPPSGKWPFPRFDVFSRFAYLHGIQSIIEAYPNQIKRLRILQNLIELLEHHPDFLLLVGSHTYSLVFKHTINSISAFTLDFFKEEDLIFPVSTAPIFYFYYNQRMLIQIFNSLELIIQRMGAESHDIVFQLITSLSHVLFDYARSFTSNKESKNAKYTVRAIISSQALAFVGSRFSYIPGVLDAVLSSLNQCLMRRISILDKHIVNQMVYTLLSRQSPPNYSIIMDPFKKLIISSTCATNATNENQTELLEYPCTAIINTLETVALNLQNFNVKFKFMQDLLEIYIQLSSFYRKNADSVVSINYMPNFLSFIIRALSCIIKRIGKIGNVAPEIQSLFKNFWVCLVVLGSANVTITTDSFDVLEYYREISTFSPPLVVDHLRSDLQYNISIENTSLDQSDLAVTRNLLIDCLECRNQLDISGIIMRLPALHIIFLAAIFEQETLAVEKDTSRFPHLFLYLEDSALEKDKQNIGTLVEYTCNKIFQKFLDRLAQRPNGHELDHDLIKHVTLLLVKFNSERKRVQRSADKYLTSLMNRFPHMLWSSKVILIMLDFMHVMKLASDQLREKCMSAVIELPHSDLKYTLPDTKEKREEIIMDYQSRCDSLIKEAAKCSPTVLCSILLDYMVGNRLLLSDNNTHYGIELLMSSIISSDFDPFSQFETDETSTADNISPRVKFDPTTTDRRKIGPTKDILKGTKPRRLESRGLVTTCTYTATYRSQYLGKIKGILTAQKYDFVNNVKIYPDFENQIADWFTKNDITQAELSDIVMLSAAYICLTKRFVRKIIFQLCNLSVTSFTTESIKIAIESWEWIFGSCKYHQVSLLGTICSALDTTIYKGLGLFDFSLKDKDRISLMNASKVHDLWIIFLMGRFEIVKFYSPAQIIIISQSVGQILKRILSAQPNHKYFEINAVTYLRVISFGLKLLQNKHLDNIFCRIEMREKIFKSLFLYFSSDFIWPDAISSEAVLGILCNIYSHLSSDRKWQNIDDAENVSLFMDTKRTNFHAPSKSNSEYSSANKGNTYSGTLVLRRSKNVLTKVDSISVVADAQSLSTIPISHLSASDTRSYTAVGVLPLTNEDVGILRSTLIQLCGREIERLAVWSNPLDKAESYAKFSKNLRASLLDKKYSRRIKLLWRIHPKTAISLSRRFVDISSIHKDVCNLVRQNPTRLLNDPSAVNYFWSSDQDVSNLPDYIKSLILLWERCPVSRALEFLSPHLNSINIYTTQYAISCFKCSPIDIVLFYVPQLVQCLRNDPWSYVLEYVLWISQRNNLISHQFIWNMQTNAYTDDESTVVEPILGQKLCDIIEQIEGNFNEAALKFYTREFGFFNSITKISSILKPYDKPKRRQICQEELSKIVLQYGVYIPTNPDSIVLSIDYTSGIPMQSAAKAPFLARFEVNKCDTEIVEQINIHLADGKNTKIAPEMEDIMLKGAIFKVGDDVRQDVLALQIISLIKDIFKNIGLNLHLYPYKVVATAYGCGVIECVPNAKTRDQLGKETDVSLNKYFVQMFGNESTSGYKKARENFTNSLAAYSVVSYILQVKDRHNGNIMINNEGCIIHIDFGYLFESSPGGNMGFEPDMKITAEMINILGGSMESAFFKSFVQQAIRGFLAIRPYREEIVDIVALMLDSNLPCFRGETIKRLRSRFASELSEKDASMAFEKVISDSCLNIRTKLYDLIQMHQNEIPC